MMDLRRQYCFLIYFVNTKILWGLSRKFRRAWDMDFRAGQGSGSASAQAAATATAKAVAAAFAR